jgi:hypothetical protein
MKLYCPDCKMNVETIVCETYPATRYIPADHDDCCPNCGKLADDMWEPESWEGEYDEVDNSK